MARVLIIEDEENLRFSMRRALERAGHQVEESATASGGLAAAEEGVFDALVTDVNLGAGADGLSVVQQVRERGFEGAIVVVTGYGSVEGAVAAMKQGADDYLLKPVSLEELGLLLERLLEERRARTRLRLYQRLESARDAQRELLGESPAWRETVRLAERLAKLPLPKAEGVSLPTVLLLGETGTGKGLLARHVHRSSESPDAPFVHVNCTALPANLVESELFGHERGAFTDAKTAREGLFEMADGGTIFLDEIGDMPADLQAKLLTVLEEGAFRRVGGSKPRRVKARVIAATNLNLAERVERGEFRRDLFYRLNAFTVTIPALRERNDDAVLIGREMAGRFGKQFGRVGLRLSPEAEAAVRGHGWPGNVRELINALQRAALLCDGEEIGPGALGLAGVRAGPLKARPIPSQASAPKPDGLVFDFDHGVHTAEEVEKQLILQALARTRGNVSRAARLISMQRSSLRYRIERYNLHEFVQELTR